MTAIRGLAELHVATMQGRLERIVSAHVSASCP